MVSTRYQNPNLTTIQMDGKKRLSNLTPILLSTRNHQKSELESDDESDEGEEGESVESETESVSAAAPAFADDDRNTELDLEECWFAENPTRAKYST